MADNVVKYTLTLTDLLTGKLDAADKSAKRLETTMGGLQRSINTVGAAFGIAFGLGQIRQAVTGIVDAGTKVEDARVGLTTLLRDSKAAGEVITNTMEDATKTPFAFEGLLQANKALISAQVNAKDARATVLDLANGIAATGGGDAELQRMVINLQQIKNTGKATALDIKQFAYAGINVYQLLADATGKPIEKVKELEVSYGLLTYALKKAHEEGGLYANGLENMAGNTSVRISNLGDALFQLKVRIFDDLKPAITSLLETGMEFIAWMGEAWEWTKRNKDALFALAKGIVAGIIAYKAFALAAKWAVFWKRVDYASINILRDGYLTASKSTIFFAGSLDLVKKAIMSNPIGIAVTAIGAITAAYQMFTGSATDAKEAQDAFSKSLIDPFQAWADETEKLIVGIADKYENMTKRVGANGELIKFTLAERNNLIQGEIDEQIKGMKSNSLKISGVNEVDPATRIALAKFNNWKQVVAEKDTKNGSPKNLGGEKFNLNNELKTKEGSKVQATRATNITIHIGSLVKELSVHTTTISQGIEKVKEMVTQAMLSAVNDSQVVAGQ